MFLIVTGGCMSGIGKGITTSSLAVVLKHAGYNVTIVKIDPYLNLNAGLMSPFQHGETFVLSDGGEVDLDLGTYERFLRTTLTSAHNITTGQVYRSVLERAEQGGYLGETVQVVPHITDEIQNRLKKLEAAVDICLVEIGGTVGDIESRPFIEAVRQLANETRVKFVHVTDVPFRGEPKTKPTQHSVMTLRSLGLTPDLICLRSKNPLPESIIHKVKRLSGPPAINLPNVDSIYEVPTMFYKLNILDKLSLPYKQVEDWVPMMVPIKPVKTITVAVVGKYTGVPDTYLSLQHAIHHAAHKVQVVADIKFLNAEKVTLDQFSDVDAFIIPGGFDSRGIDGMIATAQYARLKNVPLLGICLGMQIMVLEYARHWCEITEADSTEWNKETSYPVITDMPEKETKSQTFKAKIRLGAGVTILEAGTQAFEMYQKGTIAERHRHRFEVNPEFVAQVFDGDFIVAGQSDAKHVDVVEMKSHTYFVGVQFHPEFLTHHNHPHPLFVGLFKKTLGK